MVGFQRLAKKRESLRMPTGEVERHSHAVLGIENGRVVTSQYGNRSIEILPIRVDCLLGPAPQAVGVSDSGLRLQRVRMCRPQDPVADVQVLRMDRESLFEFPEFGQGDCQVVSGVERFGILGADDATLVRTRFPQDRLRLGELPL